MPNQAPAHNLLLGSLDREVLDAVTLDLRAEPLPAGRILFEPASAIDRVWFPVSGVVSLLTVLSSGDTVELASVGREGMLGVQVFLEAEQGSARGLVQVDGEALVLPVERVRSWMRSSPGFRRTLATYVHALIVQVGQSVACNRFHALEQRAARWLLVTHDRVSTDVFFLTHEFLAGMLGVRRASVTEAAAALQRAGVISYRRGRIRIEDREGLEAASCECYGVVADEYARLVRRSRERPAATS